MSELVVDLRALAPGPFARRVAWLLLCLGLVGLLGHRTGYASGHASGEAACGALADVVTAGATAGAHAAGTLYRAARDPVGYVTELTVAAIVGSACPSVPIVTPVLQVSDACELSDRQWAYIVDFYAGRNDTEVERFLGDDAECAPVMTDASTLGRPQLSGCPLELRVLAAVAWARGTGTLPPPAPPSAVPAQKAAVSRLKSFFALDAPTGRAGTARRLRETCEAILDCEECFFGFRVDWGCVRERLNCAYRYVRECGMFQEDHERAHCEELAICAIG